jgi:hypothetical protein
MQGEGLHMLVANTVREACIRAALDGYQQASISGLCHEGAFEVAVDAIRMLDVAAVVQPVVAPATPPAPAAD